jgi:acetylornithine/succinyldiaminopimelate/putrescine aminotransferase
MGGADAVASNAQLAAALSSLQQAFFPLPQEPGIPTMPAETASALKEAIMADRLAAIIVSRTQGTPGTRLQPTTTPDLGIGRKNDQ